MLVKTNSINNYNYICVRRTVHFLLLSEWYAGCASNRSQNVQKLSLGNVLLKSVASINTKNNEIQQYE